ncbi:hypothetical protein Tco_1370504 [Tanacetum coccineum]
MSHPVLSLLARCDRLVSRAKVMSSPSALTVPETITPTDKVRDSLVITPFHNDSYMLVRQAYIPVATYIESEPLEDPIKTKETQPLTPRTTPLSPDYNFQHPHTTP